MGPSQKKLICERIAQLAIPDGGGFQAGIDFLLDPAKVKTTAQAATTWVAQAITLVRTAAEPNPWKTATDEEIAGEILSKLAAKRGRK